MKDKILEILKKHLTTVQIGSNLFDKFIAIREIEAVIEELSDLMISDLRATDRANVPIDEYLASRPDSKAVTDEMIEKWAMSRCKSENESRYIALKEGAKAHRDNKIR